MDKLKYVCTGDFHPKRGSEHAAGIDLYNNDRRLELKKGDKAFLDTKTAFQIPTGWVGLMVPRSGLGSKGLRLSNSVGVIDSDYTGNLRAMIEYHGDDTLNLPVGCRFCQLVIVPYLKLELEETNELPETERGDKGFGSTGDK